MKRTQKLLTKAIEKALPPLYSQDGKGAHTKFYARFFHNSVNMTWFVSEFDGDDTFFGVASINGGDWEWGYISKEELENAKMRLAGRTLNIQGVERDTCFSPREMHEISELQGFMNRLGYTPATKDKPAPTEDAQTSAPSCSQETPLVAPAQELLSFMPQQLKLF